MARWEEDEDRERSRTRTVVAVIVALALWTLILVPWLQVMHNREVDSVEDEYISTLEASNDKFATLSEGYDEIRDELLSTGQVVIPPPTAEEVIGAEILPTDGADGKDGEVGPQGPPPTDEQVRTAVVTYLTEHPPAAGRAPSEAEIAAAVAAFCEARGGCAGPEGAPGTTGAPGEPGEDGEPGPAPTTEQIAEAVASFCQQNNGCVGATGPAPESLRFTYLFTDYVCTDQDDDLNYECVAT